MKLNSIALLKMEIFACTEREWLNAWACLYLNFIYLVIYCIPPLSQPFLETIVPFIYCRGDCDITKSSKFGEWKTSWLNNFDCHWESKTHERIGMEWKLSQPAVEPVQSSSPETSYGAVFRVNDLLLLEKNENLCFLCWRQMNKQKTSSKRKRLMLSIII